MGGDALLWFWPRCAPSDFAVPAPTLLRTLWPCCAHSNLAANAPKSRSPSLSTLLTRCARSDLAAHALKNHKSAFPPPSRLLYDSVVRRYKYREHIPFYSFKPPPLLQKLALNQGWEGEGFKVFFKKRILMRILKIRKNDFLNQIQRYLSLGKWNLWAVNKIVIFTLSETHLCRKSDTFGSAQGASSDIFDGSAP